MPKNYSFLKKNLSVLLWNIRSINASNYDKNYAKIMFLNSVIMENNPDIILLIDLISKPKTAINQNYQNYFLEMETATNKKILAVMISKNLDVKDILIKKNNEQIIEIKINDKIIYFNYFVPKTDSIFNFKKIKMEENEYFFSDFNFITNSNIIFCLTNNHFMGEYNNRCGIVIHKNNISSTSMKQIDQRSYSDHKILFFELRNFKINCLEENKPLKSVLASVMNKYYEENIHKNIGDKNFPESISKYCIIPKNPEKEIIPNSAKFFEISFSNLLSKIFINTHNNDTKSLWKIINSTIKKEDSLWLKMIPNKIIEEMKILHKHDDNKIYRDLDTKSANELLFTELKFFNVSDWPSTQIIDLHGIQTSIFRKKLEEIRNKIVFDNKINKIKKNREADKTLNRLEDKFITDNSLNLKKKNEQDEIEIINLQTKMDKLDIIKKTREDMLIYHNTLFNNMLSKSLNWKYNISATNPLKKNDVIFSIADIRPINFNDSINRLTESGIKKIVEDAFFEYVNGNHKYQHGFFKGSSTIDALISLVEAQDENDDFIILYDLIKAYDCVLLEEENFQDFTEFMLPFIIEEAYVRANDTSKLKKKSEKTRFKYSAEQIMAAFRWILYYQYNNDYYINDTLIKKTISLIQGSGTSPILFNVYIHQAIKRSEFYFKKKIQAYADDLAVQANESNIFDYDNNLKYFLEKINFKINKNKSIIIIKDPDKFSEDFLKRIDNLGYQVIKKKGFKYLGFNIEWTIDFKMDEEAIDSLISKNSYKIAFIRKILPLPNLISIFKQTIYAKINYGVVTTLLKDQDFDKHYIRIRNLFINITGLPRHISIRNYCLIRLKLDPLTILRKIIDGYINKIIISDSSYSYTIHQCINFIITAAQNQNDFKPNNWFASYDLLAGKRLEIIYKINALIKKFIKKLNWIDNPIDKGLDITDNFTWGDTSSEDIITDWTNQIILYWIDRKLRIINHNFKLERDKLNKSEEDKIAWLFIDNPLSYSYYFSFFIKTPSLFINKNRSESFINDIRKDTFKILNNLISQFYINISLHSPDFFILTNKFNLKIFEAEWQFKETKLFKSLIDKQRNAPDVLQKDFEKLFNEIKRSLDRGSFNKISFNFSTDTLFKSEEPRITEKAIELFLKIIEIGKDKTQTTWFSRSMKDLKMGKFLRELFKFSTKIFQFLDFFTKSKLNKIKDLDIEVLIREFIK